MGERRNVAQRGRAEPRKLRLGPGAHLGKVELLTGTTARVRLLGGAHLQVEIAPEVEPLFVEECLRHGRTVILADGESGPLLVGALQTSRAIHHGVDGTLEIDARTIRLRAESSIAVEVGSVAIRAEHGGTLRLEGERLSVDVSSVVRFLSARVELP